MFNIGPDRYRVTSMYDDVLNVYMHMHTCRRVPLQIETPELSLISYRPITGTDEEMRCYPPLEIHDDEGETPFEVKLMTERDEIRPVKGNFGNSWEADYIIPTLTYSARTGMTKHGIKCGRTRPIDDGLILVPITPATIVLASGASSSSNPSPRRTFVSSYQCVTPVPVAMTIPTTVKIRITLCAPSMPLAFLCPKKSSKCTHARTHCTYCACAHSVL